MKVAELIEKLSSMDSDMEVNVSIWQKQYDDDFLNKFRVIDVVTSCNKDVGYSSVIEGESLNDTTKFVEIIWN